MPVKIICILILFSFVDNVRCSLQGQEVSGWAHAIGEELRSLSREVTLYDEIKQRYTHLEAKVGKKDPRTLLNEIKENISRMIDRKTDAIKCIQQKAEKVAETFEFNPSVPFKYHSSKWSSIDVKTMELPKYMTNLNHSYLNMYLPLVLNNDTHFYNLPVNTNHSSVHVPTNVFEKEDEAAFAIQWSEALNEVFTRNYNSDPALSWQYFGSSSGIMRHYPAKRWEDYKTDLFDCRIRTWFIEAATCTKDAIILMDNSGSMKGMGHHIGSLTASSILDTFSNNDFINVLNYSSTTNYTIPCFENMLVQATKENIGIFRKAIELMQPEGKTDIALALEVAFNLLGDYREKKRCGKNSTNYNQAIMIITDGVNSNLSDVVIRCNYLNNGSNIPVRIFTYLVGKEVSNIPEIKWLSCANRGYYTPVQTLEQVTWSVLQYIGVVARPLVLQGGMVGGEHPVSWTHAYADRTYDDKTDNQINEPYRLLTSAAVPCYDTKTNKMNNTRTAYLLGVAGTDVPLDEFNKMMMPYKIGVNGYSFIVSNNGYVLMHPDLRPMFKGILKDNYNSIDLTQVEQHNDALAARKIGDNLKKLRQALVYAKEGSLHDISLSYHYDDMKRISEENFDYYYTPIAETPFTIGIAIPDKYGNYSLEVGDEIQRTQNKGINLTSFFIGKWKVHPKWVYCKYHYQEVHEFDTPEQELVHFLGKMRDGNFKWERQYEEGKKDNRDEVTCGRKTLEDDDYYCDKQLVQRLIFDAKNTYTSYNRKFQFKVSNSSFTFYNPSLRFVATMSGLTRWEYLNSTEEKEFGDLHPRAINEKWYKNAVLQHQYDNESFVYSVPFDCGSTQPNPVVTGSYAIFPLYENLEAPGSVVGFQFSQTQLKKMVTEKSTNLTNQCEDCLKCDYGNLTCYVVDSSGYIIVSDTNDTGRFFGEVEGDILYSMLKEKIFKNITVFDYQALCGIHTASIPENKSVDSVHIVSNKTSGSSNLITPFKYMQVFIQWLFIQIMYFLMEVNIHNILEQVVVYAEDYNSTGEVSETVKNDSDAEIINKQHHNSTGKVNETVKNDSKVETINKNDYYACETEIILYVLQQDIFNWENFTGEIYTPNIRNYYVKKIPYSNLIFVAINNTMKRNEAFSFSTAPRPITKKPIFDLNKMNSTLLPCQKLDLNNLPRRCLTGCYNEHPLEHEIVDCGRASHINYNLLLYILVLSIKYI